MAYSKTELIYFVCATLAEAEARADSLRRQGIPARIVRKSTYRSFEVRIPRRKEDLFQGWRKSERKDDVWRGPTEAELKKMEGTDA